MKDSNFFLSYFSLNVSSFLIKVLNFILFIFLVKFLSIKEYGVYVLVWTQINFFTPLLDFGTTAYGLVHLANGNKAKLQALLSLRFYVCLIVFILTIAFGLLYGLDSRVFLFIFLSSFSLFSNTWFGSNVIVASLEKKVYIASLLSFIFTLVVNGASVIAIVLTKSLLNVFILIFIFYSINAVINWYIITKLIGNFKLTIEWELWKNIIKGSLLFVIISFLAGMYFKIDVLLLGNLKTAKDVGVYSAGYKFYEALMFLVGSYTISVTPVLAGLIKKGKKPFLSKIKKDVMLLGLLGIVTVLGVSLASPIILPLVLKEDAVASVHVLQIVIWALPCMLLSSIFFTTFYVFKKAHIVVFLYIIQLCLNVVLNVIFIPHYSYVASSYITVINEVINLVVSVGIFIYLRNIISYENLV
jgi:O-antigen/teichoic acid export membrane protein